MDISDAVVLEGASRFALEPSQLRRLERGGAPDGVVFDVEDRWIVKFVPMAPERLPQFCAKLAFIRYLGDNGICVPVPLPSVNEKPLEVVSIGSESWVVTRVARAPGHHLPPDEWDQTFFRTWGQIMGRMHRLSADYPAGHEIASWREEHAYFTGLCRDEAVGDWWESLGQQLAQLPEERSAFGLIHNDLHPWNLLVDGTPETPEAVTVLDFDVCTHHWFATDIAIALFHPIWELRHHPADEYDRFVQSFKSAFLGGYCDEYSLSDTWLERLPLFARYRRTLFYLAMVSEHGLHDPEQLPPVLKELRRDIVDDTPILHLVG